MIIKRIINYQSIAGVEVKLLHSNFMLFTNKLIMKFYGTNFVARFLARREALIIVQIGTFKVGQLSK